MSFSLVFRRKGVQYPKVMMIAAFFSTLPWVESNFTLSGPIFKIQNFKYVYLKSYKHLCLNWSVKLKINLWLAIAFFWHPEYTEFFHTLWWSLIEDNLFIFTKSNKLSSFCLLLIHCNHQNLNNLIFISATRTMLPTYYGLLRQCCAASVTFCRTLANHQNIQWAFKNIAPFSTQV